MLPEKSGEVCGARSYHGFRVLFKVQKCRSKARTMWHCKKERKRPFHMEAELMHQAAKESAQRVQWAASGTHF